MRWTDEADELLYGFAHKGAEFVAREIYRETGAYHTVSAVKRRASRLGISLMRYEICPRCGGKTLHPSPDGYCPTCKQRELAEGHRKRNARLREELRRDEYGNEFQSAKREHQAARAEGSRLRKQARSKGILPPKRPNGNSVDLSKQLSLFDEQGQQGK